MIYQATRILGERSIDCNLAVDRGTRNTAIDSRTRIINATPVASDIVETVAITAKLLPEENALRQISATRMSAVAG